MKIGMIGLGRMGAAMAKRFIDAGHEVIGYDPAVIDTKLVPCAMVASPELIAQQVTTIWLMIPQQAVDEILKKLGAVCQKGTVIIDGGNSNFHDSIQRAAKLEAQGIDFLDCGTSGGMHADNGYALTIGGKKAVFDAVEDIFRALGAPGAYAYVGPSGAGHYVKMVHNGIEYALLAAYAEGFDLLHAGRYKELDLAKISAVWCHGAVIRSYILELIAEIYRDDRERLKIISGKVDATGMGAWTVEEAHKLQLKVPLIEAALNQRDQSQKTGGTYATKLVALLRNKFGGHPVS